MTASGYETEVKFHVRDLQRIETRLLEKEARLIQARTHESNLRLDTDSGELKASQRALRLRQDGRARITLKGPSREVGRGVSTREEIEFEVEDFERAKQFLEALGYQPNAFYEKFRRVYEWQGLRFMLDELPYGYFVEIEGEDVDAIYAAALWLGLAWGATVNAGYRALYERIAPHYQLNAANLSFEAAGKAGIDLKLFGVCAADEDSDA